jgi:hypothetical protein
MLFAIIDYLSYRDHKDHYSFREIERDGGLLGTKENFPNPAAIPPFSSLFYHPINSFISWMIMYYTNSLWSHYAMFLRNGYLTDQTTGGSTIHPFCDYLDGKGYIKIFIPKFDISKEKIDKLEEVSTRDVGNKYNYPRVIKMFLQIILGFRKSYRLRFSIDLFIISALLIGLLKLLNVNTGPIVIVTLIYIFIILLNILTNCFRGKRLQI